MDNCIFCKISNNQIPSKTIFEDEIVKVFLDINPISNGHIVIIPKKHFQDLVDIDEETLNYIMKIAKQMYTLLNDKLKPIGIRLVQNNGSFQEVKHYHLHLIPTYENKDKIDINEVYNLIKK